MGKGGKVDGTEKSVGASVAEQKSEEADHAGRATLNGGRAPKAESVDDERKERGEGGGGKN